MVYYVQLPNPVLFNELLDLHPVRLFFYTCIGSLGEILLGKHFEVQSNLSTTVSHGELQKWPLLTGGRWSGKYIQS